MAMIARGRHLVAIARDGIRVETPEGSFHAVPEVVTASPADVGPVDAVVLTVKAWQVREAAAALRPMLSDHARVLPLQNGVEAAEHIEAVIGPSRSLIGLARIVCMLTEPGVVRHVALKPTIALGELGGAPLSSGAQALATALQASGVTVEQPADMHAALWEKLLFLAALSGVGAVARSTTGELRACKETRRMVTQLMEEVYLVGRANGVHLGHDSVDRALAILDGMSPESTTSMQRDIVDRKPSELEAIIGVIERGGRAVGVETPVTRFVYGSLLLQEGRARNV